ncbi:MAG: hypothetical protein ACR2MX_00860, partial [Cyclobacteriaceae bacterium]
STNIDGDFEMKIGTKWLGQDHTISLSSIGYNSQQLTLDQVDLSANQLINLEPTATSLSEVVIRGKRKKKEVKQARLLVQKALAKIPKNYVAHPYLANTFYRHYCSENDDYVRLIEAALDIYSPRNNFEYRTVPDDRLAFKVTQLRRSFDFTESAKVYHPSISINYLLSNDFTSFDYHNPLKSELSDYDFYISDTTYLDQEPVIRVQFEPNQGPEQTGKITYSGTLFILENDLAFIRAEIEEVKNKRLLTDSIYSATGKIVTFKEYQNKYYLDRVTSDLRVYHAAFDSTDQIIDTLVHKSHVELIANNTELGKIERFKGKEPQKNDLLKIKYDSAFWANYTILKETEIEAKIIADLSNKVSLDQQFKAFNTIESGGTSILETPRFKEILDAFKGTPLYLVIWSRGDYINHIELEPLPYFKRMIRKEKARILLISIDESEEDWQESRKYLGLNKDELVHRRIGMGFNEEVTKRYFRNVLPYYLVVDKKGQLYKEPPLPYQEQIKPVLQSLIKKR